MKIYTETVIYSAPQAFVNDAPYQLAIVTLDNGRRLTGRIAGDRVAIGDEVKLDKVENGISYFKKI